MESTSTSASGEHPLEGLTPAIPAERHSASKTRVNALMDEPLTVKEAAADVSARRHDPIAQSVLSGEGVDEVRYRDDAGEPLDDPKATFKQSDLRRLAKAHTDYRQRADAWLGELYAADAQGRAASPAAAAARSAHERVLAEFGDLSGAEFEALKTLDPEKYQRGLALRDRLAAARGEFAEPPEPAGPAEPPDAAHRERLAQIGAATLAQDEARAAAEHDRALAQAQAALALQEARAAVETQARGIGSTAEQIQQAAAAEFPELASGADARELAARLAQSDPQRAARLTAYAQQAQAVLGAVAQLQAYAREVDAHNIVAQRQRFDSYAREEDAKFQAAHPELKDSAAMMRASADVAEALRARGLSDADLARIKSDPAARSALGQEALLALGRQHVAQRTLREKRAPLPPVQRPGVARDRGTAAEAELRGLTERLDQTGNLRDAAKLLVAKRRATRR